MTLKDKIKFIENGSELTFLNIQSKTSVTIINSFLFNHLTAQKMCDLSAIFLAKREGYDVIHRKESELIGNYTVSSEYDLYKTEKIMAA